MINILPYRTRPSEAVAYKPYKRYKLLTLLLSIATPPSQTYRSIQQQVFQYASLCSVNNFVDMIVLIVLVLAV